MKIFSLGLVSLWISSSAAASSGIQETPSRNLQFTEPDLDVTSYLCDSDNKEIAGDRPHPRGQGVRVCVSTTRQTQLRDVYLLKFNSFKFVKLEYDRNFQQIAIDSGIEAFEGATTLDCIPGSTVCSFTTFLQEIFYDYDGEVECIGQVALQSGSGDETRVRQLNVNLRQRSMQEFIGTAGTSFTFELDGRRDERFAGDNFDLREHWHEQTPGIQALYIIALLLVALILCCVCAGLILWGACCADIEGEWIRRFRDPDHDGEKGRDGNSETYSVDEDDMSHDNDPRSRASRLREDDDSTEYTRRSDRQVLEDELTKESSRRSFSSRKRGSEQRMVIRDDE